MLLATSFCVNRPHPPPFHYAQLAPRHLSPRTKHTRACERSTMTRREAPRAAECRRGDPSRQMGRGRPRHVPTRLPPNHTCSTTPNRFFLAAPRPRRAALHRAAWRACQRLCPLALCRGTLCHTPSHLDLRRSDLVCQPQPVPPPHFSRQPNPPPFKPLASISAAAEVMSVAARLPILPVTVRCSPGVSGGVLRAPPSAPPKLKEFCARSRLSTGP